MLKIITAIGNEYINNILKNIEEIQIISKDIQYKEGIIEILERFKDIDYILLNKNIEGYISLDSLTEKIKEINKNIKIILIINKKEEKTIFINNYYYVLYENEIKTDIIYNILKINTEAKKININDLKNNEKIIDEKNIEIKKEIKKLKKIMTINKQKNNKLKKDKIIKKLEKIKKLNKKTILRFVWIIKEKTKINKKNNKIIPNNLIKNCQVFYTIGPNGIGKSTLLVNLSKTLSLLDKKILIVDLDFLNNSIHTILGVKNFPQKNYINKINNNIDLMSIIYFNWQDKTIQERICEINILIIKYRKFYDYIFIDTNSHENFIGKKYLKILDNCDHILFISGCNLLEINKSVVLLEYYLNNLKINNEKLNIIFNKYSKYSINQNLLKRIFYEIDILGFIEDDSKNNFIINKNTKNFEFLKNIKNNYIDVINIIEKKRREKYNGN